MKVYDGIVNLNTFSLINSNHGDCYISPERPLSGKAKCKIPSKGFRFYGSHEFSDRMDSLSLWDGFYDVVMIAYKLPIIISGRIYVSNDYGCAEFLDDQKVLISKVVDISVARHGSDSHTGRLRLSIIRTLTREMMRCVAQELIEFVDSDEGHFSYDDEYCD